MDDSVDEEQTIEITTKEITQVTEAPFFVLLFP